MSTIAEQLQTIAENIPKVYEAGQKSGSIDVTAEVGQTIIVKEVDENGKPTKWESAEHQPRTHWTEEVVILPETTAEVVTNEDIDGGAILPEFTLVGGAKYAVKYNGAEYVCECIAGETEFCLGNVALMTGTGDTGEPFVVVVTDGLYIVAPLDGSTSVTLSIEELKVIPIPAWYMTNARPYYIEVSGDGSTDDPYVCNDTVANIEAIYRSGREISAKLILANGTFFIYRLCACGVADTSTGLLSFIFYMLIPGLTNFSAAFTCLQLTPLSDGTYNITSEITTG